MRILHVAALAFPAPQGTQALVHAMASACAEAGHDTHVVAYGASHGPRTGAYHLHRAPRVTPMRGFRAGPSLEKVAHDVALGVKARALLERLQPELVVAHHVEAGSIVASMGAPRWAFLAHTSLSAELPDYFPAALSLSLARAGATLDRALCRRAPFSLAVSPLLATRLTRESGREVQALRLPWRLPPPITAHEARTARRTLGLGDTDETLLYAGNLDAYQGLDGLVRGLRGWLDGARGRRLLVLTAEPRARVAESVLATLRERVVCLRLATEADRRLAHAACDVVVVPRKTPGGVPIKLVDALARGRVVIAPRRALAEIACGAGCCVLADDADEAWRPALDEHFALPRAARERLAQAARDVAEACFAPEAFVSELCRLTLSPPP